MTIAEWRMEKFTFFAVPEKKKIERWLRNHGFNWDTASVCGDCCGIYADEYWVNGIGGEFPPKSQTQFKKWAEQNRISVELIGGYTIRASGGE